MKINKGDTMNNTTKTISFDQELWLKIDKLKGDVPRSRFVARLIADGLSKLETQNK
jgi:hypothetical protein